MATPRSAGGNISEIDAEARVRVGDAQMAVSTRKPSCVIEMKDDE
jgi:hypothetical protein